jgi:UDP:flavonoid glycosyltransferase YjiC (YdhE family)
MTAKTILFAWELGRGLGHVMAMCRMAQRLRRHGFRLVGVWRDLTGARLFPELFDEMIVAPPWSLQPDTRAIASSATLNDVLTSAGLGDPDTIRRLLMAWNAVLNRIGPDLVIADFAPAASIAVRGRLPLVQTGNGYYLPPHEMRRFPLLHRNAPPVSDEAQTLATVNAALQTVGQPILERLPQIFEGDACLVQTFGLLDPYDTQRVADVDGPILDRVPGPRAQDAATILAYLSGGYALHPAIIEALKPLAKCLRLYAPAMPEADIAALHRAGAQIENAPLALADALPRSRLFIHRGGSGSAAEALLAGVPQLVLSAHIEQDLIGEALQDAGVARLIRTYAAGKQIASEEIEAMATDVPLAAKAAELGRSVQEIMRKKDALSHCETVCLPLLR